MKAYRPNEPGQVLANRFHVTVSNVFRSTAVSFLPKIEGPLSVTDWRFHDRTHHVDGIHYTIQDQTWTTDRGERSYGMRLLSPRTVSDFAMLAAVLFAMIAILFPIALWWKRR